MDPGPPTRSDQVEPTGLAWTGLDWIGPAELAQSGPIQVSQLDPIKLTQLDRANPVGLDWPDPVGLDWANSVPQIWSDLVGWTELPPLLLDGPSKRRARPHLIRSS